MTTVRLNKFLAQAGLCSRRKADELIAAGRVLVNGEPVADMGMKVDPSHDAVSVDGKEVGQETGSGFTYVLLHKPVQVVSTARDPQGRKTVLEALPPRFKNKRLFPVGRLDYFSEGLLLLTDDGELTHRMTHPRFHLPKVYQVLVRELPEDRTLERMRSGMTLEDGTELAPVEAKISPSDPHLLVLTLHQGINRQIRRMCMELELTILKLCRTQVGPLYLGSLANGSARELNQREKSMLRDAVGLA